MRSPQGGGGLSGCVGVVCGCTGAGSRVLLGVHARCCLCPGDARAGCYACGHVVTRSPRRVGLQLQPEAVASRTSQSNARSRAPVFVVRKTPANRCHNSLRAPSAVLVCTVGGCN